VVLERIWVHNSKVCVWGGGAGGDLLTDGRDSAKASSVAMETRAGWMSELPSFVIWCNICGGIRWLDASQDRSVTVGMLPVVNQLSRPKR
jgi:hypothetical protein